MLEEVGDRRDRGRKEGADAVDIPGIDAETIHSGRGG